jgi:hypothetical protein
MADVQRTYQPAEKETPDFDGHPTTGEPCLVAKDAAQVSCAHPMCEACQLAKARRRRTGAKHTKDVPEVADILRSGDLSPGDCVSMDQYESSVRGRLPHTRGMEKSHSQYCGGTLFVDHASGRIFVYHQSSLSGPATVAAKHALERESLQCGIEIKNFHTDNGIFKSHEFEDSLTDDQYIDKSGVGAHHQNAVAEKNIARVQSMARSMLLHLRIHWPDEFSADLWPFALDYAVYIYNHFPKGGKPLPMELFCGTKIGCKPLRRLRVFGCPCYVLDPRLQDGRKIPKWKPRSRMGQFLGFSGDHSSSIGLIRNIRTGYLSPQFHVVYDERFETVASELTIDLSELWIDLFKNSRDVYNEGHDISVDGPLPPLADEWREQGEEDNIPPPKQGEVTDEDQDDVPPVLPVPDAPDDDDDDDDDDLPPFMVPPIGN